MTPLPCLDDQNRQPEPETDPETNARAVRDLGSLITAIALAVFVLAPLAAHFIR